jgi:hypothetical protein
MWNRSDASLLKVFARRIRGYETMSGGRRSAGIETGTSLSTTWRAARNPLQSNDPLRFYNQLLTIHERPAMGVTWHSLRRSPRVSSARMQRSTGWKPTIHTAREGWIGVAREWKHVTESKG